MNKRALLISLVVGVVGALLLLLYLSRFEQEASGGERVRLLMAVKAIEPGTSIQEDALTIREVPLAYVEDRAVKAVEKAKVVGLRIGTKVEANQTLMWTDLAIAADERRDLSSLVQPGARAVSIKAESGDKSFSLIQPGDYVDVIASMPAAEADKRNAVVLLQKVLALAVGLETAPEKITDSKDERREMVLTLSVSLQEAQLLSLAAERGKLLVALRNPDDQTLLEGIPDMPSSALEDKVIRSNIQGARKTGPVELKAK
ncbi:MAG: Flp pilus assembly protein CpaB [Polyangiaceae bacterium]|nr:Flp pilus assembly protein CpaB [Polyangiaceae bacterium]MBK8996640.1 Flp pilus assembly protein CpaB [Myxococcales bacterium]MCE7889226.1 Flp pilus assembly protein CpaB [Sorangiineae bacterium PRO1]MCL4754865.1 Flp pilus assembly protein CpaB [Myxococcales bacterium]